MPRFSKGQRYQLKDTQIVIDRREGILVHYWNIDFSDGGSKGESWLARNAVLDEWRNDEEKDGWFKMKDDLASIRLEEMQGTLLVILKTEDGESEFEVGRADQVIPTVRRLLDIPEYMTPVIAQGSKHPVANNAVTFYDYQVEEGARLSVTMSAVFNPSEFAFQRVRTVHLGNSQWEEGKYRVLRKVGPTDVGVPIAEVFRWEHCAGQGNLDWSFVHNLYVILRGKDVIVLGSQETYRQGYTGTTYTEGVPVEQCIGVWPDMLTNGFEPEQGDVLLDTPMSFRHDPWYRR